MDWPQVAASQQSQHPFIKHSKNRSPPQKNWFSEEFLNICMAFTVLLKARSPPKRRVHRCQNLLERVHFGLRDAVHTPAWKHARRGRAAGLPRGMFRLGIWAAIPFTLLHFIMALLALLYVDQESPGAALERAKTSSERVHVFTEHGKRKRKRQNHTGTVERLVLNSGDKPPIEHGTRERERERKRKRKRKRKREI